MCLILPAMQNLLTFVACRLFLPRGATRLPKSVANSLYQIVAMVAQQFEGYIFTVNIEEVSSFWIWQLCRNPCAVVVARSTHDSRAATPPLSHCSWADLRIQVQQLC